MFYVLTSELLWVIDVCNFISNVLFWMLQPYSNLNASLKNEANEIVAHVFSLLFTVCSDVWKNSLIFLFGIFCFSVLALVLWGIFFNTFRQVSYTSTSILSYLESYIFVCGASFLFIMTKCPKLYINEKHDYWWTIDENLIVIPLVSF